MALTATDTRLLSVYENGNKCSMWTMPVLISENGALLSVSEVMMHRLNSRSLSDAVKEAWNNNDFITGDGVFSHPSNGNVKVVLDATSRIQLTSDSVLQYSALLLGKSKEESIVAYDALSGKEFSRKELSKYGMGKLMNKRQAKEHPINKLLARNNTLLSDYVDYIFAECSATAPVRERDLKSLIGYFIRDFFTGFKSSAVMGVYLAEPQVNFASGRLWTVQDLNHYSAVCSNMERPHLLENAWSRKN